MHDSFSVLEYLYNNREHLMEKIADLKYMKENSICTIPAIFHEDVMSQYRDAITKIVLLEVADATKADAEVILITLEGFDLKSYLDG